MITITLQKIRDASPCTDGWAIALESKGGNSADMNAEFPLSDVLDSNALDDALWCLRCLPEHDKLWRKYAVWCARQVQHLMTDQRSVDALDVAWRHSEGEATDADLAAAKPATLAAAAAAAAQAAASAQAAWAAAQAAAGSAARAAQAAGAAGAAAAAQKAKLIEILTAGEWVE